VTGAARAVRTSPGGGVSLAVVFALLASVAAPCAARGHVAAQDTADVLDPDVPADSVHPGAYLQVYLLTAGPGDAIWEQFGHNALRIVDERDGTDWSWNWGIFDFDQEGFMLRLVKGTMLYTMAARPAGLEIANYRAANRPVWQQELALDPERKWRLLQAVLENSEDPHYRYDYYRDNCSTRVRDKLDIALQGALSEAWNDEPTGRTYRWHTRRLLQGTPWAYLGIHFVLGPRADRPISVWEEAFLPMRLQERLRSIRVTELADREVSLVRDEHLLIRSDRPPVPEDVDSFFGTFLAMGLLVGTATAGAAWWAERGSLVGRLAFLATGGLWATAAGLGGTVLLGAWLFTDHVFWGWNENLMQANPLFLGMVFGSLGLLGGRRLSSWCGWLAVVLAALSLTGVVVQPLPLFDQVNGEILGLTVPPNLALAYAAMKLASREGTGSAHVATARHGEGGRG